MREIDFDSIRTEDLLDHAAISEEFKKYLMEELYYDEGEADFVVAADFSNPYDTPFIMQDFVGCYDFDGKEYEVRYCYTDFCACGLFHLADVCKFEFYMLFDSETLPDNTVGSYQNAKKLYLV